MTAAYKALYDYVQARRRIAVGRHPRAREEMLLRRLDAENERFARMVIDRFPTVRPITDSGDVLTHTGYSVHVLNVAMTWFGANGSLRRMPNFEEIRYPDHDAIPTGFISSFVVATSFAELRQLADAAGFDGRNYMYRLLEEHDLIETTDSDCPCARDDAHYCEKTDEYYSSDDGFSTVNTRHGEQRWCESAVERYAFWCEASEQYWCDNPFSQSTDIHGNTVCESYVSESGSYTWSNRAQCWVHDAEWDENEHGDEPQHIYGYHNGPRWRFDSAIGRARQSMRGWFGLEIEMEFHNRQDRTDFASDFVDHVDESQGFLERDGSLNDDLGVEAVFRPYALADLRKPDSAVRRMFEIADGYGLITSDKRCLGRYIGSGRCGTHVTVDLKTWCVDSRHVMDVQRVFYGMRSVTEFLAARRTNSYASLTSWQDGKYCAIRRRDNGSYEFRAFAGATTMDQVLSYCEYIDAIVEWTRDPYVVSSTADPDRYQRQLLEKKTSNLFGGAFRRYVIANATRWPALAARFGQQHLIKLPEAA